MKKLLGVLLVSLMAVPSMAFYETGQVIELNVFDRFAQPAADGTLQTKKVQLTCGAPQQGEEYSTQICENTEEQIRLSIDDHSSIAQNPKGKTMQKSMRTTVYAMEWANTEGRKEKGDFVGDEIKVHRSRDCKVKSRNYVYEYFIKYEGTEENPGFLTESLNRSFEGQGTISLSRWYDPQEYTQDTEHDMVMFDLRSRDGNDHTRFCQLEYPTEGNNTK